jgi:5'(3')-deoxyribonucleotidase
MRRILVDMDGVIADVYTRFLDLYEQETGIRKNMDDLIGIKEGESFPEVLKWVDSPGFFRSLPVIPDSQRVLKLLNEVYEILIVSMATEFPASLTDKQLWINEYFPFLSWRQVVFCGNKSLIPADIMIDDHFKNLDNFQGETIMFIQPHNINSTGHKHKMVSSWLEIEKMLLPQAGS